MATPRSPESVAREDALDQLILARPSGLLGNLRDALDDPDAEVRSTAAYGLGEIDDSAAVPLLIGVVEHDPDDTVVEHALKALETYLSPAIGDALLREAGRRRRRRAPLRMAALQLVRYDSGSTVAALRTLLEHPDVAVRDAALESLNELRPAEREEWERIYLGA